MSIRKHLIALLLTALASVSYAGTGQIVLINADGAGEGLNDPTDGAARLAAFNQAIQILNGRLDIDVNVEVRAQFNPLTCTANSAVLGSAGANGAQGLGSNSGAIQANTWYPVGLFNELRGSEQNNASAYGSHEINATFNSNIGTPGCLQNGGWDYSFGTPAAGMTSFLTVVLHEIIHGLGFSSSMGSDGSLSSGFYGIYDRNLTNGGTAITSMNQSQRAAAMVSGNLQWTGASVTTEHGSQAAMYAPNPYEGGSSVSHFDTSHSPDQLMEPSYTSYMDYIGLSANLLEDLGWTILAAPSGNNAPVFTSSSTLNTLYSDAISHSLTATDADSGDSLTFSLVSSNSSQVTASVSGSTLTVTPINNYTGASTIQVRVTDGTDPVTQNITVNIRSDFSLTYNSTAYNDSTDVNTGLNTAGFTLSGGTNSGYNVAVDYQGQNVTSSLLSQSGSTYNLAMPTSGAFAGSYTVTVTDSSGLQSSFTIKRPTRLISSHSELVTESTNQYLYIEGGVAGSSLDIAVTAGGTYLDTKNGSNSNISSITVLNNSAQFNRTAVVLKPKSLTENESATVQVDSVSVPAATKAFNLLETETLNIKVTDTSAAVISGATVRLTNDSRIDAWGLDDEVTTNESGVANLIVVADQSPQVQVSATGYSSNTSSVTVQTAQQTIQLQEIQNPLTITGVVTSTNVDLAAATLSAVLVGSDDSEITATLSNIASGQFSYSVTFDGDSFTAVKMVFRAGDVTEEALVANQQDQVINSQLNETVTTNTDGANNGNDDNDDGNVQPQNDGEVIVVVSSGSSGGGGHLSFVWMMVLSILITITTRKRTFIRQHK